MIKRIICYIFAVSLTMSMITASATGSTSAMTLSQSGLKLIEKFEGFSATAYQISSQWYIGYGTSCTSGAYPSGITEAAAETLLRTAIQPAEASVNSFLSTNKLTMTQTQFDAMTSFTYNLGTSWMDPSNRISSYLINGITNYSEVQIVNALSIWCHVGKVVNAKLVARRLSETALFLFGDYSGSSNAYTYIIYDPGKGSVDHDIYFYKLGQPLGSIPAPKLTGFTFNGWYTADGRAISAGDIAGIALAVTAKWTVASTASTQGNSFPDVKATDWYYPYVNELSYSKIICGFPDGTFKPNNTVSCAEALKLILLSAGYGEQPKTASSWASGYLNLAISKGLIETTDITDLTGTINRQLIAKLAAKSLGLSSAATKSPFSDCADPYVLALYQSGIIEGANQNGTLLYKPGSNITRSEISAIVWRINALNKSASSPAVPGSTGSSDTTDHTNQIQYGSKWLDILKDVPVNAYDKSSFYTKDGLMQYTSSTYKIKHGIDVSSFQGVIDWKKVKAAGVDFAMIRLGYRGYGTGSLNLDSCFQSNMQGALNAGVQVGVYFFSQAISTKEALDEANYVLSYLGKYNVTYPVVFDWEYIGTTSARTDNVSTQVLCDSALAFCNKISGAGYTPMVYFNQDVAYLRYDLSKIMSYKFWLAQYTSTPTFYYDFQMWQYSCSGTVNGIQGKVDMDISFEK